MVRRMSSGSDLIVLFGEGSFRAIGIKKGHRHPPAFLGEAVPVQTQRALLGAFAAVFEADRDA